MSDGEHADEHDEEHGHDDHETDGDDGPTTIGPGRNFEEEYRLSAAEVGEFLIAVGERLRDGEELTVANPDGEWRLPFAFGEPVELEVEYEGVGDPELELEVEIPGQTADSAPDVA